MFRKSNNNLTSTPRLVKFALTALIIIIGPSISSAKPPFHYHNAIDDPMGLQKSQVFDVYGDFAIRDTKVHIPSLRLMFNTAVKRLTGLDDAAQAWRCFIHDDDIVALKFTWVGGKELGTNNSVAAALLQTLYQAGFKPENFMLVGLDELPKEAEGTRSWPYGWQKEKVNFGSDSDYLARWLDEVTAIINIASIMDDNIMGLRGSLANLSLPLLKSPARLYLNGADPFITEIYDLPQIRDKVRLHIANDLRILYYGGPQVRQSYVVENSSLIFSTDPVALDRVALELIRQVRQTQLLPQGADDNIAADYLDTAQAMGLGYADLNFIDYHRIKHDKSP